MLANNYQDDEFLIDAVGEVLNIGMGVAAAALSEMIEKEVILSAPVVEFIPRNEAIRQINPDKNFRLSGVSESFSGPFSGTAILLFPERQSLELVRALIKPDDLALDVLSELEQEAITETGNVILNACLCSIADFLHNKIESSIPEFVSGSLENIINKNQAADTDQNIVLLLKMNFAIEQISIQGYVTFMMDAYCVADLREAINASMGG